MSLSITTILDAIAPQFASDPDKTTFIIIATGLTSTTCFGDNKNLAIALRAAHMMTLKAMEEEGIGGTFGGVAGAVISKREGDSSIGFANPNSSSGGGGSQNEDLNLTRYGKQLLGLIRGQITSFSVTGAARPNCEGTVDTYEEEYLT